MYSPKENCATYENSPSNSKFLLKLDFNACHNALSNFRMAFLKVRALLYIRYLLRLFDCLAHPNLGAPFATDQKWPICHLRISYQSLAGGLRSLQKSEFLKLIISFFHYFWCQNWNQWHKMSGKNTHTYFFYSFCATDLDFGTKNNERMK